MKKLSLIAAVAACALTASAQGPRAQPGVVITKVEVTKALVADMEKRGMKASMDRITESLDNHLAAAIVASRKFTVLQRGITQDVSRRGMGIELRENDYTIAIDIDSYLDKTEARVIAGRRYEQRTLHLSGQVTIANAETWEVLDKSNIQMRFPEENEPTQETATLDMMLPELTRKFAEASFERIMDFAFPFRVIDAEDGILTLNRGADFVSDGEKVDIYGKGRTITDPDSGQKLTVPGRKLGTATIILTAPTYSQAEADGNFAVTAGAEVRKIKKQTDE